MLVSWVALSKPKLVFKIVFHVSDFNKRINHLTYNASANCTGIVYPKVIPLYMKNK